MRFLLDTQILVWALAGDRRVGESLHAELIDPANAVFFSAAGIWEVAIKHGLGRPDFRIPPVSLHESARAAGFDELIVSADAAATVATLPHHHRDPFDRLLLAQAIAGDLTFYTADAALTRYGPSVACIL